MFNYIITHFSLKMGKILDGQMINKLFVKGIKKELIYDIILFEIKTY